MREANCTFSERGGRRVRQSVRAECLSALSAIVLLSGCATPVNPNPPSAAANTGYVDFYCESDTALSWDVFRLEQESGKMKPAYSKYAPLPGNVLRITSPPGSQRFQVNIFNRAHRGPAQVTVDVENGKITPVKITLEYLGQASVDRQRYSFRGSAKGYGRGTKIVTELNDVVKIHAEMQALQPYQPREQVAYFNSGAANNELSPTGR